MQSCPMAEIFEMLRIFLELRFFRTYFSMLKICENNQIPSQSHAVYEILLVDKDCGLAQLSVHADHKKGA